MERRHVVIGTAGHVDHGKTALVQALTGTDTDRWAEEKRRGITIDLGFARLDLGEAVGASVVDVPGHEDFVRNMVAGATGVDVALLVVAADEGVMPQTREHLEILRFLDVTTGVVAVTKTDLVDEEWLELVVDDVMTTAAELTAESGIVWSDPVAVSAKTGAGLDVLRSTLAGAAERAVAGDASDLFRMPVDRSFSIRGAGTVVTGTTWSGTASVGDEVFILPRGDKARIRSIEVHDQEAATALPGRRTALALVGVDRDAVGRGSWIVTAASWRPSRRIDAHVTLLDGARPLTQRSRIRVHIGTSEIMARVTPAAQDIPPGGSGVVRLRLDEPLVSRWGDRGVLRAYSPMVTVGGCVVVDPRPDPRPRRPSADPGLRSADPAPRLRAFVSLRGAVSIEELPVRLGVHPDRVDELVRAVTEGDLYRSGTTLLSLSAGAAARMRALEAVTEFHRSDPLKPGLPLESFRRAAGSDALAEHAREALEEDGSVVVTAGVVRLAHHAATLDDASGRIAKALRAQLPQAGAEGVSFADFSDGSRATRDQFTEVAEFLTRTEDVIRIGTDRYYGEREVRIAVKTALDLLGEDGGATPAELRDRLGLSRKYLIPLLEWMDGQGITGRDGDVRRRGPKARDWV